MLWQAGFRISRPIRSANGLTLGWIVVFHSFSKSAQDEPTHVLFLLINSASITCSILWHYYRRWRVCLFRPRNCPDINFVDLSVSITGSAKSFPAICVAAIAVRHCVEIFTGHFNLYAGARK